MKATLLLLGLLINSEQIPETCKGLYNEYIEARDMMINNPSLPSLKYITERRRLRYQHCVDMYNKVKEV